MSTTSSPESAIDRCQPADATPVALEATALESTAPEYLRELKRELTADGLVPAELTVAAYFDEDCSLATQEEVDRIRGYVRAGSFLARRNRDRHCRRRREPREGPTRAGGVCRTGRPRGLAFELEGPISVED